MTISIIDAQIALVASAYCNGTECKESRDFVTRSLHVGGVDVEGDDRATRAEKAQTFIFNHVSGCPCCGTLKSKSETVETVETTEK